jgi:hypothetical protein
VNFTAACTCILLRHVVQEILGFSLLSVHMLTVLLSRRLFLCSSNKLVISNVYFGFKILSHKFLGHLKHFVSTDLFLLAFILNSERRFLI